MAGAQGMKTLEELKEGIRNLQALAEGAPGDHIHYDVYNSLEEGSSEMIIQRVE